MRRQLYDLTCFDLLDLSYMYVEHLDHCLKPF